ncbi:NAD-dependent epimerase/dehydratase family protein [Pseudomonas aeruginosa]
MDEDTPKSPLTPYASDKLASEYYLDFYRRQHGLEPAIFRFFNVYGPRPGPVLALFRGDQAYSPSAP